MADKDARVRLNLAAAGFLSSMQQLQKQSKEFANAVEDIGGAAEKSNRKASGFFGAVKAGATGAKSAVSELLGHLRSAATTALTLGGSLSLGAAVKEAQEVTSSYKDLAFAIRVGTGEAVSWQDVQKDVEAVSGKWKRSNKEIQESYQGIFAETGNLAFSKAAIDSVGQAADATGKSTQTWSDIAGTLNEKFGIGAGGINSAMATVVELTNKGGATAEELASKLGLVGASAKLLGLQGEEGLKRVLGMTNLADDAMGTLKQKFGAVSNVMEQMADPERLKAIEKALGVKLTDAKGGVRGDAIERIIAKTKGDEGQLRKAFGQTEVKLVSSMAKPFIEAFEATKGSVEQKTAAGLDAYNQALKEAGKTTFDGAALQEEASSRLQDAPRKMQEALNDFTKVFERPEMVHAVDQIAAAAPKLARALGNIVEFATNHPILAAGAAIGAVGAAGAVKGAAGSLTEKAASAAGDLISKKFTEAVKGSSAWATAGNAFGVVAAAGIGFALGKVLADFLLDDRLKGKGDTAKSLGEAQEDAARAAESKDPAKIAAAKANLEAAIAAGEKKQGGIGGTADAVFGGAAKLVDSDYEDPAEKALRGARQQLNALNRGPARSAADMVRDLVGGGGYYGGGAPAGLPVPTPGAGGPAGPSAESRRIASEVARGEHKTTIANADVLAAAVARQLGSTTLNVRLSGGGSGSNGLPPAAGNGSGSMPK